MGMYNEVFTVCPKCGKSVMEQIGQVVLGFGGFNLDNPESLAEQLTVEELKELHQKVKETRFYCNNEGCWGGEFDPLPNGQLEDRKRVAQELFGKPTYGEPS